MAAFLSYLAVDRNVAASTQNQALNASFFSTGKYWRNRYLSSEQVKGIVRAKKPKRLPVVLTPEEVAKVLSRLNGIYWLIGCLQYGSGLRLMESARLRVMDLEFDRRAIYVRNGKDGKDRVVTLADD